MLEGLLAHGEGKTLEFKEIVTNNHQQPVMTCLLDAMRLLAFSFASLILF